MNEASAKYTIKKKKSYTLCVSVTEFASNCPKFIFVIFFLSNHIDCRQERPRYLGVGYFDFVYYRRQSSLRLLPNTFFFFFSAATLTPRYPLRYSEAIRSLQRSVFTNFISFLWGIKSSRSRPRREEGWSTVSSERRREGSFSVQIVSPCPTHPRVRSTL